MNTYEVGNVIRCTGLFTTAAGVAQDPTAVYFQYILPSGVLTTLTYLVDAALVRTALGTYHVDLTATTSGEYDYRFYSTGVGQASDEDEFIVSPSHFP